MTVPPAFTEHLPEAAAGRALQRMSLDVTAVTGVFEDGTRAHVVPCLVVSVYRDAYQRIGLYISDQLHSPTGTEIEHGMQPRVPIGQ